MSVVPGYTAGVSPALLSTASHLWAAILHHGLGSQRAVRRETPVSPACSPPKRRGDSHPSGKRTWISFTCGLVTPLRHDLVSLAPPPVCPSLTSFSSAFMSGTDIALRNPRLRRFIGIWVPTSKRIEACHKQLQAVVLAYMLRRRVCRITRLRGPLVLSIS